MDPDDEYRRREPVWKPALRSRGCETPPPAFASAAFSPPRRCSAGDTPVAARMHPGVYPMWIAKTPVFAALLDSFWGSRPDHEGKCDRLVHAARDGACGVFRGRSTDLALRSGLSGGVTIPLETANIPIIQQPMNRLAEGVTAGDKQMGLANGTSDL
jgi:hypothetical protein